MLNVVTSVDGATAVGGVSGPLGSPADKAVFAALALASVLVISPSRIATLFGLVLAVPIGLRQLLASRQRPVPPAAVAKRVIGSS